MPYAASRLIKIAAVAGMAELICGFANAQSVEPALPTLSQPSLSQPALSQESPTWLGLAYESHNGSYLDSHGWLSTTNDVTVNLGGGLSMGLVSSLSNGNGLLSGRQDSAYMLDPAGGWYVAPNQFTSFGAGNPAISTFGGRMSMDIGGGLSVNVAGNFARVQDGAYYMGQRGMLGFSPNGTLSSEASAGVSMDFGNGSSLSISGGVSRNPMGLAAASCGMLPFALCH